MQATDGAGGYIRSWQDIVDLWAEITPVTGREKLVAMQLESSVTHRIVLRFRSDVRADMRLVSDTCRYNIRYVAVSPKQDRLELLAEETAAS